MLKQGLNYVKSLIRQAAAPAQAAAASKNIFMDCCVRAPCVPRRSQMCRLRFDLRTRRNRAFFLRALRGMSCDQKQLRSRTASTWILLHAHKDMFLQNDCCDLAPPDKLMHTKTLRFRHGGTSGSHSKCKKRISIMINKQDHAIKKTAAFSRCGHTWISFRSQ